MSEESSQRLSNDEIKAKFKADILANNMIVVNKIVQLVKAGKMKECHEYVISQMTELKDGKDKKTQAFNGTIHTNVNNELLETLLIFLCGEDADVTKQLFIFELKGLLKVNQSTPSTQQ